MIVISFLIVAYLLGSFPTAVWIGKAFYNIDVREFGSGNAGATNTFRVLGRKAGVPVLIIDILKGALAVSLSYFSGFEAGSTDFITLQMGLGIAALIGHIFPIFAGFRGGKGVATLLGVVVCVNPLACSIALLVFLAVLFLSRYVSVSSMAAGVSFPIILNVFMHNQNTVLMVFSVLVSVVLIITHRNNITRLLNKQETRIRIFNNNSQA